jgi:hypothetical protein
MSPSSGGKGEERPTPMVIGTFFLTVHHDGFGDLVVSMLASGTQGRGFKPGMPSSGGEVK